MTMLKYLVRKFVPANIRHWLTFIRQAKHRVEKLERNQTRLALFQAKAFSTLSQSTRPEINQYEFSVSSQNGEDGILLYIFSKIGTYDRRFVEFGIGHGQECNTANLSLNFGWQGLLMDVDERNVALAQHWYAQKLRDRARDVQIVQARVTRENINQLIEDNLGTGKIDLLSIDIDSNDYWVWDALTVIQPRVVVIEYNASFGMQRAVTVPYQPEFYRHKFHPSGYYHGASLRALTALARRKGYVLVGCDTTGVNAFFVQQELINGKLTGLTTEAAFYEDIRRTVLHTADEQFRLIEHLALERVEEG